MSKAKAPGDHTAKRWPTNDVSKKKKPFRELRIVAAICGKECSGGPAPATSDIVGHRSAQKGKPNSTELHKWKKERGEILDSPYETVRLW